MKKLDKSSNNLVSSIPGGALGELNVKTNDHTEFKSMRGFVITFTGLMSTYGFGFK